MSSSLSGADHAASVPPGPYVLAFMIDDALERALREALGGIPLRVVREITAAREVLRSPVPAALVVVTIEDESEGAPRGARISREQWPRVPVVVIGRARSQALDRVVEELCAEAIPRSGGVDELVVQIRERAREGARLREAQRALAMVFASRWRLSERQRELVLLLAYGVAQNDLGDRLGISTRAVDQHLRNIRDRCGEVESCGLIQRLLELTIEMAMRGEESWLARLGRWHPA